MDSNDVTNLPEHDGKCSNQPETVGMNSAIRRVLCPDCGYCKECGRSDRTVPYFPRPYQVYPWYPTAPYYPFWYTNVGVGTAAARMDDYTLTVTNGAS